MKTIFNCAMCLAAAWTVAGCATERPAAKPAERAADAAAAKPAAKPAPKPRNALERLHAFVKAEVNDPAKKLGTADAVKMLEDYRATNPDCTNLGVRVALDYAILARCGGDGTPRGAKFDAALARETVFKVAPRIHGDPKVAPNAKFKAVNQHCSLLCDLKRFDEAIEIAKRYAEAKDEKGAGCPQAFVALKNVYRYADRYAEALAAVNRAIDLAPQKGDYCAAAANLALEFGDVASVPEIWKRDVDANAAYKTMLWTLEHRGELDAVAAFRDETLKGVLPFAADAKNPSNQRFGLACRAWIVEDSPRGAALRGAVRDVLTGGKASFDWSVVHKLKWTFMDGNWKGFAAVYADLAGVKQLQTPELRRAHLFSLAALGRVDEAEKFAADYRAGMDKPLDLVKTDALLAVAQDRDALPLVAAAKLDPKDHARVVQLAATWSLVLQKNDSCRRYSEAYAKLLVPIPRRRQNVTWSDRPLDGEAEWRALWPSLEKSFVDVKMCGDLDNLVTDVATGRVAVEKTDKDTKNAKMEVTTACDVKGVHVYLRVADPNARAVEDGFAGGKGTEMYFAPGDNQPYVCFGGGPGKAIQYLFSTSYTWAEHQRLVHDDPAKPYNMKGEMFFSDADYVTHLFFPWDAFYQKLPTAGSEWKFECLTDGFSWGGSQGVHESSSWGRLAFNLSDAQLTAIRRRLLLKNAKKWKRGEPREYATVAPFDRWADPVVGDPAFYEASLKPLEAELSAFAKRVKPDMTDADVNEIYERAVPRWIGLKHEIDRLRREYLVRKSTAQ
ncbi:MAG: tetratricopeptide repeat protein [Kiritimatiellae bacterium]|nr:tetratricopeptide repeat protein [Kiritimatiellia bacterium]